MADKKDTQAESSKGSIGKKILVWGLVAIVLVGAAVGSTLYLTNSLDKLMPGDTAVAAPTVASTPVPAKAPPQYMPLDPPFVISFEDEGALRYLQVHVSVMARDGVFIDAVLNNSPRIRNNLILLIGDQDLETLSSTEGKEQLRSLVLQEIQEVVEEEIGQPGIEAVYFTNFVMQ